MSNKPPHQSQTSTEDEGNMYIDDTGPRHPIKSPQRSLAVRTGFSVWPRKSICKSRLGLFYHCVLIV